MISDTTPSCFPNASQGLPMYPMTDQRDHINVPYSCLEAPGSGSGSGQAPSASLLYNLSILEDKVNQLQSLVSILISPDQIRPESTRSFAIASLDSLVQEIIGAASSMLFVSQHMSLGTTSGNNNGISEQSNFTDNFAGGNLVQERGQGSYPSTDQTFNWYDRNSTDNNRSLKVGNADKLKGRKRSEISEGSQGNSGTNYDIVELDAEDLLAKYTHYCQVCGKGFKRDANLRMHMRAHGDEYKTNAALVNPVKSHEESNNGMGNCSTQFPKRFSCPYDGCRWNQKHANFQPLKSMICVKNHYKRSHCPKMYVCKRCNRKQFSVLSDLRTHEKHCGDLRWQCSCGNTFSRKDKLMGHVALFVGHRPVVANPFTTPEKLDH